MGNADIIGGRGESIAFICLTKIGREDDLPYFWPHFLGEKCATFDFLVELVDAGDKTPFFFVQVKTTRKELTKKEQRLVVGVSAQDVRRMVDFPAPTYVVGVHEDLVRAFVVSVHGEMNEPIASISTGHELNHDTLKRLWEEVRAFWQTRDMSRAQSAFLN
jgi:Domain of unknown function (DUF4365)